MIKKYSLLMVGMLMLSSCFAEDVFAGERMAKYLDLNDEQVAAIATLKSEKRLSREAYHETRETIKALIEEGDVDQAANLAAEQARQKVLAKAEFRDAIKGILSPEQFEKWEQMPRKKHHGSKWRKKSHRTVEGEE